MAFCETFCQALLIFVKKSPEPSEECFSLQIRRLAQNQAHFGVSSAVATYHGTCLARKYRDIGL
jgi:hypothetical protein